MLANFDQMPDTSRVWVYQSSRKLTTSEATLLESEAKQFVENWTAHQAGLKSGVKIYHDLFIVFAVDESHNDASGCSIDKKVAFLKLQEQKLGTGFFERMNVAFINPEGNIEVVNLHNLDAYLKSGKLNPDTKVFNHLVSTMSEFRSSWCVSLKDSWMKQFISATPV